MKRFAIVLAAGQGKRMKSKLYKVLHPVCGKPMVGHVLQTVQQVNCERSVVVVGHGAEAVRTYLQDAAEYVLQEQQLGTGHAVKQAKDLLGGEEGSTIVICGDTPLVTSSTLENLLKLHESNNAAATVLTAHMDNPKGYGRVIRGGDDSVQRIVEQKDCSPAEDAVTEINTGTYCFDNKKLFAALEKVTNQNAQQEYYLTDCIGILKEAGETVLAYQTDDYAESIGVNDRLALSEAEGFMRERINRMHMLNGVTIIDPASTYIGADVTIGADTVLYPGTVLKGNTVIGENCVIGPNSDIEDSVIADGASVKQSVLSKAEVGARTSVGPFAYLRPGAKLGEDVKVGDFVEVKNATIDNGSKVSHLSYVGDAKVGKNVNIGCGAITVNYDGYNKSVTEIEDDAFIGSNVNLIAPVKVGKGAFVVAGSTITQSVDENDLAIARQRQENKPGYAEKIRARAKAKKNRES
ncbi:MULTISPECIES: bifunctional UDP-N-acetylglucosamine diphosphorylase/glucosamine-1-phosphate N-acetyltransferase GlmU [Paenibacillus]|uniref:Bifunctional protein GlmU n=2 Tax=Paenibacillus lactis TaxID=228574 RepID=G4HP11_9BACL|nr:MULTISPECIES: bifunctional UDP-N-acetylglucosamine diphosphorylase/glucosamine-1-phosphate N-acetyltransferase GlmU [Paenibacillus]EHB49643.1 UDP-N-acetylglucosamine pyrophosphorylase [Paenibacillus lactis 154]MBP1896544.1 bifunctional UDP-N-acetylglucosamine pyrophosphorylase/glucosamine-1-phosphate N-acetyltransferase [Paenibacillus lactis]GIO94531.1 bifunctional protein GlmU [Paenibacillus lactis]HAF99042.1 bifunctional UDP-N-acetylglucosamine diphosphorylase/glucosamine-1-phosphate N-ace